MFEYDCGDCCRRTDGRQPQPSIRVFTHRVVDSADNFWHLEYKLGNLRRHDVPIVTISNSDKDVSALDAGPTQDVLIDPRANDCLASKVRGKAIERCAIRINDRDIIASVVEQGGNSRADTAALAALVPMAIPMMPNVLFTMAPM
jgi:hypothetical protein